MIRFDQNTTLASRCRLVAFAAALALVVGCGSSDAARNDGGPASRAERLTAGTKVTVVEIDGDFAKVRDADDNEFFVPASRLKKKSTATIDDAADHTHLITSDVDAFLGAPPTSPPQEEAPRTRNDIYDEQAALNGVFLTENTHKIVIAPNNSMNLVDEETGERCWRALACHNPDCPAQDKGTDGYPFLFICHNRSQMVACPECLKIRNVATETPAEQAKHASYARAYVLSETARRVTELDAERRRATQLRRQRRVHQ